MEATHRVLWIGLSLFFLAGCNQAPSIMSAQDCSSQMVANSYLVRWNGNVPAEFTKNALYTNSVVTRFTNIDDATLTKTVLSKYPNQILFAEHEYRIETVNDKILSTSVVQKGEADQNTWGPGDVQASQAWSYLGEEGDGVTVAVVDSGIDVNHPLLAPVIAQGGYSWVGDSSDLTDGIHHGSHVSGIIAGQPDGNGFTGVAPHAMILPLKFIDSAGNGAVGDAISAIGYALSKNVKVINASWGGTQCSASLQQEILTASQAGAVFINAAGNSSSDISVAPEYPAVYQAPGKLTVASYDSTQSLSYFTNFGALVDLAAPGGGIYSTVPPDAGQAEGQMATESGTSMSTPFVSAVAALLFSANPSATPAQVVAAINASVYPESFDVRTGGKVNAYQAAQYFKTH